MRFLIKLKGPLLVWFIATSIWILYRRFFVLSEIIEELILKPIVFIYPVLIYLHYREKLSLKALGFNLKNRSAILLWGLLFGLFLAAEGVAVEIYKGYTVNASQLTAVAIITNLIVSTATAISEEVLDRGFLLERMQKLMNKYVANILVSILFALSHLGIALFVFEFSGNDFWLYLLSIFISGFAYGYIYQKTRSIYAPILAHLLWNFSNTLIM